MDGPKCPLCPKNVQKSIFSRTFTCLLLQTFNHDTLGTQHQAHSFNRNHHVHSNVTRSSTNEKMAWVPTLTELTDHVGCHGNALWFPLWWKWWWLVEYRKYTFFYRQLGWLNFSLRFWPKIKPKIRQLLTNCPASDLTFSSKTAFFH